MDVLAGHFREQVDIVSADGAAPEVEIGGGEVERLQEHADILQDQRIGDPAVLPGDAIEARSDGEQDVRRARGMY